MRISVHWIIGMAMLWCATGAQAHSLNLFVHEEGGVVKGSAYFTGGNPAKNTEVQVIDAANKTVGTVQTDVEGNFIYTATDAPGPLRFVISTQDGHRAEVVTDLANASKAAQTVQPSNQAAMISYEAQLFKIHEAINRLETRLWFRDVIGGIGYIFGLAGLWALWKSRSGGARH